MAAMPPAASDAAARPILMIAPQPFFRVTGTPINVLTMCRALTEHGLAVHLLTVPDGEDVDLPGLTLQRVARLPGCGPLPVGFSLAKLAYNGLLLLTCGPAHNVVRWIAPLDVTADEVDEALGIFRRALAG